MHSLFMALGCDGKSVGKQYRMSHGSGRNGTVGRRGLQRSMMHVQHTYGGRAVAAGNLLQACYDSSLCTLGTFVQTLVPVL